MKIVNIVDGTPQIQEVPDSYIRCSVLGEFCPKEEFCNEAGNQIRTNSLKSYRLPHDEFVRSRATLKEIENSPLYKSLVKELITSQEFESNSVSVNELISRLVILKTKDPEARVYISQSGYYAEGKFAEITLDLPENKAMKHHYELGYSCQNY